MIKYLCKVCPREFYRENPNINERCVTCNAYCYIDWGYDEGIPRIEIPEVYDGG